MPSAIQQLTHEALALSEDERAHLAQTLLQSLDSPRETGVEEAWKTEVDRRLERVRQGTATGRSAEEVFRDIRRQHSAR